MLSRVTPATLRQTPFEAPAAGEPFENLLRNIDNIIMPGITHWQSPNFFGFFPANSSGPAILGDLLSTGLGVQGMFWATSPACTELETHVLDWLVDMLALPHISNQHSGGGAGAVLFRTPHPVRRLCAMLAARERAIQLVHQQHRRRSHIHLLYIQSGTFFHRKSRHDRGHRPG